MEEREPEIINLKEEPEKIPWYKGPLRIIIGLFLILIIIMWLVPYYGVKQNPKPNYTPKLSELKLSTMAIPTINSSNIRAYVQTTPEIKQLADQIVVLSCAQTHPVCNAKALFYFVQQNFNYLSDPLAFEYYKTPQESLQTSSGDCDDTAILLSSLLQSIGLRTRFVLVPRHVYVQVHLPEAAFGDKEGNWVNLDATCQSCGFGEIAPQYSSARKSYFE